MCYRLVKSRQIQAVQLHEAIEITRTIGHRDSRDNNRDMVDNNSVGPIIITITVTITIVEIIRAGAVVEEQGFFV